MNCSHTVYDVFQFKKLKFCLNYANCSDRTKHILEINVLVSA